MNSKIIFILFEIVILLIVSVILFFVYKNTDDKIKSKFIFISLCAYAISLLIGFNLFYNILSLHLKIDTDMIDLSEKEKQKIVSQYPLNINEEYWSVLDDENGIQMISNFCENFVYENACSTILISVSEDENYVGKRDFVSKEYALQLEEEVSKDGIKYDIKQYTLYDGTDSQYGEEFYTPIYLFKFKKEDSYYTVMFMNGISEEVLYRYSDTEIKQEDINLYLAYLNGMIE